jgi:hypothetical protein
LDDYEFEAQRFGLYLGLRTTKSNISKTVNPLFMKRRIRKIANFFAFNLLFFALYLNFVHQDKMTASTVPAAQNTAAFSGALQTESSAKNIKKDESVTPIEIGISGN